MYNITKFWKVNGAQFTSWWDSLDLSSKRRFFQCPKTELVNTFKNIHHFKESFLCVLCAVAEQVEKFPATMYPSDGVSSEELHFERNLTATKHGIQKHILSNRHLRYT